MQLPGHFSPDLKIKDGFIQCKNCFIQNKPKIDMRISLKGSSNILGFQVFFSYVDLKRPLCFLKKILTKQTNKTVSEKSGGAPRAHMPLDTQSKILKTNGLTGSSIQEQGTT